MRSKYSVRTQLSRTLLVRGPIIHAVHHCTVRYRCAVELCKACELHAEGKLGILLVPIQGETWTDEATGQKLFFPTPAMASRVAVGSL